MAAKQGTLAQLSQAGEDAKRAVLSRTGVTSSWFSNLNTVCTIKSAPPRSPEVLQMLATKSGWLFKRNEQHVWQVRWCCAVPHTFLYYFDANIVPSSGAGGAPILGQPTLQQQEEWNRAVSVGYGNRKQHEKRSNFYLFNHNNNTSSAPDTNSSHPPPNTAAVSYNNAEGDENTGAEFKEADLTNSNFSANMQPAGIIDLECYTSIHRSSANSNILELAGDDQVNPDLRGFYFCASSPSECEDWTDALLNGRHSALQDECEAYKQVCDGFAQQLQLLHSDIDEATRAQEEADAELYRVRSQMEELRRTVRRMVEDCFDRTLVPPIAHTGSNISGFQDEWKSEIEGTSSAFPDAGSMDDDNPILSKRLEFTCNLETIQSQDMGVAALVRVLSDYCSFLEDSSMQLLADKSSLEKQLKQTGQSDQQRVQELDLELESLKHQKDIEINRYKETFETLQGKYQQSQKELQDVQNDLSSTRMEVTMYQTQQRSKLAELQQHKKILKKEVLELRNSLEEKDARIRKFQISHETDKLAIEQEKSTSKLLERYIAKIESQVHVQQNMMEMMSQSGMGSVFGGGGGSVYGGIVGHKEPSFSHNSRSPKSSHNSPKDTHSRNDMVRREMDCDRNIRDIENDPEDDHDDSGSNQDDRTDDLGDVAEHLLRPVDTSFAGNSSHRTAHRGNRRGHDAKQANQKPKKFHSPQRHKQQHMMIDQDSDNKSHVSELTEDRTQRHFDAFNQYATSAAAQHGLSSPRTFDIIHNEFASKKLNGLSPRVGPPLHIIGVNKNNNNSSRNQNEDNDDDGSPDDIDESDHLRFNKHSGYTRTVTNMLDTINCGNTSASLPPIGNGLLATPNGRLDIPRGGGAGSVASRGGNPGKLSVAQRARMDADFQSSLVRVKAEDKSNTLSASPNGMHSLTPPKLQGSRYEGEPHRQSLDNTTNLSIQSSNSQVSHSLPSGLWKRVEEAVLGSRSDDDDDSFASRESSATSDTDNKDITRRENNHNNPQSTHKESSHRSNATVGAEFQSEIKSPDAARTLTLQERSQLQREKQLSFLREQGLVTQESDIRGGAGTIGDSGSVASSYISHSKSFLSFTGKLRSPGSH